MKKFFTLIAAVAMAASVHAQNAINFGGLEASDFSNVVNFEETTYTMDGVVGPSFNYVGTSSAVASFTCKGVDFQYKNSKVMNNYIKTSSYGMICNGKNFVFTLTTTPNAEVTVVVSAKGSTAPAFTVVKGTGSVGACSTTKDKVLKKYPSVTATLTADADGVLEVKETNAGYTLESITLPTSTGITNVASETSAKSGAIYNLAGQQVTKDYKGVVIQNGKKFVNK